MEKAIPYLQAFYTAFQLFKPRMPPIKSIRLSVLDHRCQVPVLTAGPVKWKHPDPFTGQRSCTEEVPLKHTRCCLSTCRRFLFSWSIWFFFPISSSSNFSLQPQRTAPYFSLFKSFTTRLYGRIINSHLGIKQTGNS